MSYNSLIATRTPQEFLNAINTDTSAYQFVTTTLTDIAAKVVEQKFYEISLSDYVDFQTGTGAFMQEILHNAVVNVAGGFETGTINTGNEARLNTSDIAIGQLRFPILNWAVKSTYSIFDVQQAFASMNFDLVEQIALSRKKMWDLGIQQVTMYGSKVNTSVTGLCNNSSVTSDTTTLTKKISGMTDAELQAFAGACLNAFYTNSNQTQMPNRFYIPASDYTGLGMAASVNWPNISRLEFLTNAFRSIVQGFGVSDFKILPLAYLEKARMNANTSSNVNRYILAHKNPDTMYASIPVDFTMTQFGTADNFNFYNTAYGQYAGTVILRPQEVLYFDFS